MINQFKKAYDIYRGLLNSESEVTFEWLVEKMDEALDASLIDRETVLSEAISDALIIKNSEDKNLTKRIEDIMDIYYLTELIMWSNTYTHKSKIRSHDMLIEGYVKELLKEFVYEEIIYKGQDHDDSTIVSEFEAGLTNELVKLIDETMKEIYSQYNEDNLQDYAYWLSQDDDYCVVRLEISIPHMFIGPYTYTQISEDESLIHDIAFTKHHRKLLKEFISDNSYYIESLSKETMDKL